MSASVIVDRNSSVSIDSGDIANCWKWEWLDEGDSNEDTLHCYIRKIEEAGTALCIWYNKKVTYADRGWYCIKQHSNTGIHKKAKKAVLLITSWKGIYHQRCRSNYLWLTDESPTNANGF